MRGEILAAPAQAVTAPAEHELRADGVGGCGEQAAVVDREEAGKRAEGADDARRCVDATALRRRSTIASAVASDTPAAAYVCSGEDTRPSLAIPSEAVTGVARLAGDADDVQRWLDAYVAAWASYDEAEITALFTDDCAYRYDPFPIRSSAVPRSPPTG